MRLRVNFKENNTRVKVNFKEAYKVSDGGYERGYIEGAEAGYNSGYTEGKAEGIEQGYSEGYNEGYTEGNVVNRYMSMWSIDSLFRDSIFPQNFDLVVEWNIDNIDSIAAVVFNSQNLRSVKLINKGNKDSVISTDNAFRNVSTLETVDLTEFNRKISKASWMFLGSSKLKSVYGALDFSLCTSATNWFSGAYALEDIEFVPETIKISIDFYWCTKLSKASIESIINGLSADTSGLTVTISKTAVNNAFTDEEWATLIATKPNWTISLS